MVGYLRPVKQWNDGKQAEYAMRHTYRPDSVDPGVSAAVVPPPAMNLAAESQPARQPQTEDVGDQSRMATTAP